MPAVTLCFPIYNAERFLAEAIRSIRVQTFEDFEVIAVLDGCTDRSEEILMDLKDQRFRVIRKEHNEGIIAASNFAISESYSSYNGRMDSDDVMHPERLQQQVEFLQAHPDVDVVGTWFDFIDEQGRKVKDAFPFSTSHEDLKNEFRKRDAIGGPTVMFRTDRIRTIGGYSPNYPISEDYALWLKCMANGYRLANIPKVLHHYRVHDKQITREKRALLLQLTNLAYAEFGHAIWGDDAPHVDLGAPIHRRALHKIKKILTGKY